MSIFQRLFQPEKKQNPTWATILRYVGLREAVWTPKRYDTLSEAGYQNCMTVFACVNQITKACRSVDWILQTRKGKEVEEIDSHPLLDLLYHPNKEESKEQFTEAMIAYLLLAGNSYVLKAEAGGQARLLYTLRPDRMQVLPGDSKQLIRGHRYDITGIKTDFVNGEVLHLKEFHPTNDFYGLSRIEVAARGVDISNKADEWNKKLLDNDMRPAGAMSTDQNLTESQIDSLRKQLKERAQGYEHAGEFLITSGGLKWLQMSMTSKDMDWLNAEKTNSRKICSVFGVAPELIGDSENKTYSNYQEARKALYMETVLPLMSFIASGFNLWLTPTFGDNLILTYDKDSIEALQEDRGKQYAYISSADWLSVNEKRLATGYDEIPAGDVVLVPFGKVPLEAIASGEPMGDNEPPPDQDGQDDEKARPSGASQRRSKASTKSFWTAPERKRALWDNFVLRVKAKEKSLVIIAGKYLDGQAKRAASALDKVSSVSIAKTAAILDTAKEVETFKTAVRSWYFEHFRRAGNAGMSASKGELYDIDTKDEGPFTFWEQHEKELLDMIVKSGTKITESTMEIVADLVEQGVTNDWTVPELAKNVGAKLDEFKGFRARRIARTETVKVENYGQLEGYKEMEYVEYKGWLSAFAPESRQSHMDASRYYDDHPIPLDDPFLIGDEPLDYPGDPAGSAGNIINCLCSTYPVVREE